MWACWIFWRARVSRLAIDASLTNRARATSGVVSPHSVRKERATWVSGARLGWQQVKTSRSRSSVDRRRLGLLVREHHLHRRRLLVAAGRLAPDQVDRAPPGHRAQPGDGAVGHAVARPGLQRADGRVLDGVLGQREVAGPPGEGREHVAARRPDELGELAAYVVLVGRGHSGVGRPKSMTGRTSTAPPHAAGIFAAQAIASSRSAHSSR